MNVAYLASPYTHSDPKIKRKRHAIVNSVVYSLLRKGIMVYSPLTHNIPVDNLGILGDWLTWKDFDHEMVSRCDRLLVLKLPGWEESKGVAAEMACAKKLGLPIEFMECPEDIILDNVAEDDQLQLLLNRLLTFYMEQDEKFHFPKNLATNIGGLLEHYRESDNDSSDKLEEIREQIGEILLKLLHLCHTLKIDPILAGHEKLTKACIKNSIPT